ncbi:MAG: hypothetical protein HOQ20_10850 [Bradyrhizobium sp.]|nr:hypothetical protein [Bradyrhizobium sp.]
MIVYNVKRRFFDMKTDAERYRVDQGLPPPATAKIEINDRRELAALLNELAEPLPGGDVRPEAAAIGVTPAIVNDAFFVPERDIPKFLLEDYRSRGYSV